MQQAKQKASTGTGFQKKMMHLNWNKSEWYYTPKTILLILLLYNRYQKQH
jgi:hypothetical protein